MHRQGLVLSVFTSGLLLGALLSALVLWTASGLLSPAPAHWRHGALLACALLCVLRDTGLLRLALPQNARQIPQHVLHRHLLGGALQFGFELGTGVRTYLSASTPYALAAAVLLHGGLLPALLAGSGFALGRAATPALRLASGAPSAWDARLTARLPALKVSAGTSLTLALAALLLLT